MINQHRYRCGDLQAAYEAGYQQMHDHEAAQFAEAMDLMVDSVTSGGTHAQAMAVAHEGAADVLRASAAQWRETAKIDRLLRGGR